MGAIIVDQMGVQAAPELIGIHTNMAGAVPPEIDISARLYWENKLAFFAPKGVAIPVAVSVFPDEIFRAPRSWVEKAYPKLIYFQRHPKGAHFAAWEQPKAITDDLRAGFRSLR